MYVYFYKRTYTFLSYAASRKVMLKYKTCVIVAFVHNVQCNVHNKHVYKGSRRAVNCAYEEYEYIHMCDVGKKSNRDCRLVIFPCFVLLIPVTGCFKKPLSGKKIRYYVIDSGNRGYK